MCTKGFSVLLLSVGLLTEAAAQEGHPLVGTWQGYWGITEEDENFLTLIMTWDGREVSGIANPGPGSTSIQSVRLDSSTWTVRIETDLTDGSGQIVHFVAEGKLENIGSAYRMLTGTWQHAGGKGNFSIARQGGA